MSVFTYVTPSLEVGSTGNYTVSDPSVTIVEQSFLTFTGPDENGNGTFSFSMPGNRTIGATDGTTRSYSSSILVYAYVTPVFEARTWTIKTDSLPSTGTSKRFGLEFKYNTTGIADATDFTVSYQLNSGSSSVFTNITTADSNLYYSYYNITRNVSSYGTYTASITATASSNVDYYILTSNSKTGSLTLKVSKETTISYDVTPPSNFQNKTYNLDSSGNPLTQTTSWTQGSSSYYSQGGTISGSAIGKYTATFTLTQSSSHWWTDRSSSATKSFDWYILDPYIGYSRPYINNEAYDAIIFENGVAKLVVFKAGDT